MRLTNLILIAFAIAIVSSAVSAQAPVQSGPLKVGAINSEMFASETGGITRLVRALKTLNDEFKPRRDEIAIWSHSSTDFRTFLQT